MWIVRDKSRLLHGHEKKPVKTAYGWYNPGWVVSLPSYSFPEVKWSDREPRKLILK